LISASSAAPGFWSGFWPRFWRRLLVADSSVFPLALVAGTLVGASAWLLASPARILSRQMTWDMLFNLSGAWYLHNGLAAHVDFHDPLGSLSFRLTAIGFRFTGPSVWGFIAGELVAVSALFVAALCAATRRLPLLPAIVFTVYICLLVLMPINVGALVGDYTFAMDYNAIGWSALAILSLILFVPPREARGQDWVDIVVATALCVGLYTLKITYFAAAIGAFGAALIVGEHLRRRRFVWAAMLAVIVMHAAAPYHWDYLSDVLAATGSGAANSNPVGVLVKMFSNVPELSLMAIVTTIAFGLWRTGQAPARLPVAAALLMAMAIGVLTQNTQARGLPLSVAMTLLLYAHVRHAAPSWLLVALLILPVGGVAKQGASLVAYHLQADHNPSLHEFSRPPLRGLAVPEQQDGLLDAVAAAAIDPTLFSRIRTVNTDGEAISQFEYAQTLEEAAELFDDPARRDGAVAVLDQVNPLPFMLGRLPPRGATLWLDPAFPWATPEAMLGDARYVLIPKFPSLPAATKMAIERYGNYLAAQFPQRTESRSWILLSR
jgi:hypothetical protein